MTQTLEPTESIGTTIRPDLGNSQVSRILIIYNNGPERMYQIQSHTKKTIEKYFNIIIFSFSE